MNPVPNKDAKTITGLVRKNGKVSGYELSDGRVLSKREGVALAKQGGIRGVAIASRNGSEYLRSLPDGSEPPTTWGTCPPPPSQLSDKRLHAKIPWPVTRPGDFFMRNYAANGPAFEKRDDHSAISLQAARNVSAAYFSALANSFSARSGKERSKLL